MADCLFAGDDFEIEFWYETLLIDPPNLPKLHAEGKVGYEWSGSFQDVGSKYSFREAEDQNRITKYVYKKELETSDNLKPMSLDITVKATDLRFTQLEVSDSDSITTNWEMPCVSDGNAPTFSVSDGNVVEGDSGTVKLAITVTASEAIEGKPITVDYCSKANTASTFSVEAQVQHAAYDNEGEPFLSYIEFQDVRAVFDASFPKFYNTYMNNYASNNRGSQAAKILDNAVNWLDHKGRPKRILMLGDKKESSYSIKGTAGDDFGIGFKNYLESMGYVVDTLYTVEASNGYPSPSFFDKYAITFYFSTWSLAKDSPEVPYLSSVLVNSIVTSVKNGMGLDIITDHSDAEGYGFATTGNQIANKLYANISGNIDRTGGTNFDNVRATYGDHPLIQGITGSMEGDSSEGKVDTTPPGVDNPKDYDDECSTLTFKSGETTKTIEFTVYGDTLLEGDESFYIDISNPSRGSILKSRGTALINGDDVTPCGKNEGAGGTGIEWFDVSAGSSAGLAVIVWEAYSQHDRFDVFRDGEYLAGNMKEIEDYRIGSGLPVRNNVPYDYTTWSEKTTEATRAVSHADMGVANLPARMGSGVLFIPHYPELGHSSVYQIRTDGPDGTAWAMTTYCEAFAKPAISDTGGSVTLDNSLWKSSDFFIEVLDLWENNPSAKHTFNFIFKPQNDWGDEDNMFQELRYREYGIELSELKSKMVLKSNNLVIGETPFIDRGATASVSFAFDKALDFRYLEVHVICDIASIPNMIEDYDTSLGSKMNKARQLFEITIN